MSEKTDYDARVARIAGTIASGMVEDLPDPLHSPVTFNEAVGHISQASVAIARAIITEVQRSAPTVEAKDAV